MTLPLPRLLQRIALPLIFVLGLAALAARASEEQRVVEDAARFKLGVKARADLPTLYLVGDSTMKVGTRGQRGWGEEFAPFFDPEKINVVNQAIGGRSSRTFQNEGRWDAVVAQLQPGDFVIIQFGHNDGGSINEDPPVTASTRARGTLRGTGDESRAIDNILTKKPEVVHTYGWYIRKYVEDARARGAVPIVLSPTPRNRWRDGKVPRSAAGTYGGWAREVAAATQAAFVDHNDIIATGLEALGPEASGPLTADGLHTTPAGALFNARMAVSGLKAMPGEPFAGFFSAAAAEIPAFKAPAR